MAAKTLPRRTIQPGSGAISTRPLISRVSGIPATTALAARFWLLRYGCTWKARSSRGDPLLRTGHPAVGAVLGFLSVRVTAFIAMFREDHRRPRLTLQAGSSRS